MQERVSRSMAIIHIYERWQAWRVSMNPIQVQESFLDG